MNLLTNLSAQKLRRAADIKEQIDTLQIQLHGILGLPYQATDGAPTKWRYKMSAAGRARIAAAARARWAKLKGAKTSPGRMPKRKMSATGKARLSALAKARWRKARTAGKKTL